MVVYPIGYAYRHALELALKDANSWVESSINGWVALQLMDPATHCPQEQVDKDLRGHGLAELFERLERRLDVVAEWEWVDPGVRVAIKAFSLLDEDAQKFRYPFQTRGRGPSFEPGRFRSVDLQVLRGAVEPAIRFLIEEVRLLLEVDIKAEIELNEAWSAELRRQQEEEASWESPSTYSVLPDGADPESEQAYLTDWELGSKSDRGAELLDDGDDMWGEGPWR